MALRPFANLVRARRALETALALALFSTAIALGPSLAHLFELPNKIGLPREAYFTVQHIYNGWANFAYVLLVELLSMLALVILARRRRVLTIFASLGLCCLLLEQAAFWTFTFPANVATENWTKAPANWQVLRAQWEYGHAAGALLQLGAMAALIAAAIAYARGERLK